MNVTDSVCPAPAVNTTPAAGVYTNVPGTLAVAFSCVALSAVPYAIAVSVGHVIVGVALSTVMSTVAVAAV